MNELNIGLKIFICFSNFEISGVVTQPNRLFSREKNSVHQSAIDLGIPVLSPESISDPKFLASIIDIAPDLCITAAYGNYLTKSFLAIPKFGTINIHPSLIPKYRGAAPLQRSLQNGDQVVGVTILKTVQKMDAGPILYQETLTLKGDEKYTKLLSQLFRIGTVALVDLLPTIWNNSIYLKYQNESEVTHAPKLTYDEGRLRVSNLSALSIVNHIRGFSDGPGSWIGLCRSDMEKKEEIPLKKTKLIDAKVLDVGQVGDHALHLPEDNEVKLMRIGKEDVLVLRCGDGSALAILQLQPEGKSVMSAKAYHNGVRGGTVSWSDSWLK